jgi:hypothetical protein
LGFHSDLDNIVRKICLDHQAQATGYNDLVKGHVDKSAQPKQKKQKKIAKKNAPPPTKEKSSEPDIPLSTNAQVPDAPPSPRQTEPVPMASLVREEIPSQLHVSEEGEIPQSEPRASPAHDEPNSSVPPSAPDDQPQ